jgi:hypothetical protein
MNIIADIAGRYEELMLLLQKMPQGEEIILLGDLNDRGPDSNKVIQWAIDNKIKCVQSNHGQMMINAYNVWKMTGNSWASWEFNRNGGHQTLLSYGGFENIPESHIQYLAKCPMYIETDDLILTHAPLNHQEDPYKELDCWNRVIPIRRSKFQIHGHNSLMETYTDELGDYGMCLDDCFNNRLTGIHWPSKTIYTQDYL